MRHIAISTAIILLAAVPGWGARPVTVAELEQNLVALHGKPDAETAWALGNIEPSEKISRAELAKLQQQMPGEKSREALQILADKAEFFDPPASSLPNRPAPDLAEQRRIMGLVVAYIGKTIPQLPNFLATRDVRRFEDTPQVQQSDRPFIPYQPLHFVGRAQGTVLYRDGREVVQGSGTRKVSEAFSSGLTTWGVFGPILGLVLIDAARSKLQWSHWEKGERQDHPLAVFQFEVPKEQSHYQIDYCCIAHEGATAVAHLEPYRPTVGYHGTMTIDPASGAILHLLVEADLKPTDPVSKAAIVVDYGAIEIGGRQYICPVRSISATVAQSVQVDPVYHYALANQIQPLKTEMNETAFVDYHVFRSDARIVTQNEANAIGSAPATPAPPAAEATAAAAPQPSPAARENIAPQPPASASAPPASAVAAATPPVPPASAPDSVPEVSVTSFAPGDAAGPFARADSTYTLRTTARSVDIGVVVLDKKGNRVTNLKREDFAIEDNGAPRTIRSFAPAGGDRPAQQTAATTAGLAAGPAAGLAADAGGFSNVGPARNSARAETGNTTILMIDAANLAFGDLNYAREEMRRFLKTLATGEPVGLYVMKRYGFQVLLPPTTDANLVAATLSKWMPDAQDLANAQSQEQRNRREIDYVEDLGDLFAVNGNSPMGQPAELQPVSPQLRAMGSDPARDAFLMMPSVARSLAAIPGHKSLVWVSSDNALADWSDKAGTAERGNTQMDPLAIKAEEAMNNAHVSIYPLDASQLEAGGVAASVMHGNVQLNPAVSEFKIQAELDALPPGEREEAEEMLAKSQRDINSGRLNETMKEDMHPIQGPVRELAEATGGHALRRAGDIAAELSNVVADGDSVYLLSFSPSGQPDDAYHHLTVKLVNHPGLTLRYRTGYLYAKEPSTLKDRFRNAVWSPVDMSEIALTAQAEPDAKGHLIRLKIATKDLDLKQTGDRWNDRLAIFIAERDDSNLHAHLTGKTLALALKPATYQDLLRSGIRFEERVAPKAGDGSFRVVVVDENSGRMGSVTVPMEASH